MGGRQAVSNKFKLAFGEWRTACKHSIEDALVCLTLCLLTLAAGLGLGSERTPWDRGMHTTHP